MMAEFRFQGHIKMYSKHKYAGTLAKTEAAMNSKLSFFFFYCFLEYFVGLPIENETFVKYGKKYLV